ncbi:hypothetical protein AB0G71_12425 [Streptomyces sp. NPDC020403]|uniref:hypothetical protein n=1 Tax=unclassified Streptomyces TaxID=2593676 RepID=UPI0033DD6AD7
MGTKTPSKGQRAARTLTHGQRILLRRLAAHAADWIRAGRRDDLDGLAAILGCFLRLAVLGAGAYGVWLLVRRWPAVLWVVVPVWCWAAIRSIPHPVAKEDGSRVDAEENEGGEAPLPLGPDATRPSPRDVCEAVWRVGTPHAHLAVLADELGTTTDLLREVLTAQGIPVEPVRMQGRGSSTGVKGHHFPAPATPSEGVVAAGQPANNNTNNVTVTRHASGAQITVTPAGQTTEAA